MPPATRALDWPQVADGLATLGHPDARPLRTLDEGAYSPAHRWIVELAPGRRAFVKALVVGCDARQLEQQRSAYARDLGPIVPTLLGWLPPTDTLPTLLVTEDLSAAHWGVPVTEADARALRTTLDALALHAARADDDPFTIADRAPDAPTWAAFLDDPSPLLATGLVDEAWCNASVEPLAAAAARIDPTGDGVVHGDLWRQNWCVAQRGAVLVDFSIMRGNPAVNHAWAECGVRAAGGPGGIVLGREDEDHAAWAAWMSGVAARLFMHSMPWHAELPRLRETELREAIAGLRWACAALHLPQPPLHPGLEPDGPWRP